MKILQISPYFYPHLGGVESHVLELSKKLQDRGHEVLVITTKLDGTKERGSYEGVDIRRVKPITIQLSTPIIPGIRNVIEEEKGDIIHSHSPPPLTSFFGVRSANKLDIPYVLTYHCDLEIPYFFGRILVQLYERTFGTYTVSQSDKIITTTNTYGATSRAVWDADAVVIPNAVDKERFNPENSAGDVRKRLGIKQDEHMVLYIGRIVFHKGLEYLVESAQHLPDHVKYVIGGTGDFIPELKSQIQRQGTEDRVIFPGRIPNSELHKYYAAADLFVLPSVSRLEAFGIVALEAMASGVPVVVSDIPGVREVITEGREGLLAEPMNAQNLAGKIRAILENPEMAERMGRKGRQRIEESLTWDKVTDQIEQVYRELV